MGRGIAPARGRRGQILIVTLVAICLLAGLIFYVFNTGDQVNQRLEMQGAADATAISGAVWMARSMNVVAMDNVGMSKMLSLVPLLDAQPLGTQMALEEVTAWEQCLAAQLQRRALPVGLPPFEVQPSFGGALQEIQDAQQPIPEL
jgi:hypothetical protein